MSRHNATGHKARFRHAHGRLGAATARDGMKLILLPLPSSLCTVRRSGLIASFLIFTLSLHAETRMALLLTSPSPPNYALLALAEAKISTLPGVALLERGEIDRILQEHEASLTGLVEADTAVQAGTLLGLDLLAIVEMEA